MSRPSAASPSALRRAFAGLAVVFLLTLGACDGAADDAGEVGGSAAAAEQSAGGETHTHDGGAGHAHDGSGGHTHAAADTVAAGIALDPGPDAGWTGSVTLLSVGDSVRVLISVEGAPAGSRHGAELVAGSCQDPGAVLASLTPVAAGSSGKGSSQTTVAAAGMGDHGHGAVRLLAGDGSTAVCAPVHLPGARHTHG